MASPTPKKVLVWMPQILTVCLSIRPKGLNDCDSNFLRWSLQRNYRLFRLVLYALFSCRYMTLASNLKQFRISLMKHSKVILSCRGG
ncbi:hypothetical protein F5146DRAFT_1035217 [Armillaria mellea]|nr:hypothetical protein F5146DRAFT_1035217 [Armillaria mellea]